MKFKFAIFDLDMTLVNSIKGLTACSNSLAAEFNLPVKTEEEAFAAELSCFGPNHARFWEALWGYSDPKWYDAYLDHLVDVEFGAMELFPSALPVLRALQDKGIMMAAASNRENPGELLEALGARQYFKAVVGERDVKEPKPAPDMLLKALELMGAQKDETVFIGDSGGDLQAADNAGLKIIGMSSGGHPKEELLAKGAFRAFDHLTDILTFF